MTRALERLVDERVERVKDIVGEFDFTFRVIDPTLFPAPRDYAFCRYDPRTGAITIGVAPKFLSAPVHRQDALLRHELGHAIDFLVPTAKLNNYAIFKGRVLSSTPERRADDIAEMVWGAKLQYDRDLIQTINHGVYPRPPNLGL